MYTGKPLVVPASDAGYIHVMKNAIHSTVMASEARKDVLDGAWTAQHRKRRETEGCGILILKIYVQKELGSSAL